MPYSTIWGVSTFQQKFWPIVLRNFGGILHRSFGPNNNTHLVRIADSQEPVLKVPKRGQFHAAIRVTPKCCDSCAQGAPGSQLFGDLVTRIAATSKSQIASDCSRNSKKSLRLRKHPLRPTLWTREPPVLCGFYSVSEAPHGSGNPPEYVATTRVWFRIAAIFLAQCDFCDCDTAIFLRFLREKLATSKLWLPIASDLWLRLRGSLSLGATELLRPCWPPPPYPLTSTRLWPIFDPILTWIWPEFDPKPSQEAKTGPKPGQNRVKKGFNIGWGSSRPEWLCSSSRKLQH